MKIIIAQCFNWSRMTTGIEKKNPGVKILGDYCEGNAPWKKKKNGIQVKNRKSPIPELKPQQICVLPLQYFAGLLTNLSSTMMSAPQSFLWNDKKANISNTFKCFQPTPRVTHVKTYCFVDHGKVGVNDEENNNTREGPWCLVSIPSGYRPRKIGINTMRLIMWKKLMHWTLLCFGSIWVFQYVGVHDLEKELSVRRLWYKLDGFRTPAQRILI